jgi:hypothetical protein
MRLKHWVLVGFIAVGVLYFAHMVMSHGGMQGFTAGLGFGAGKAG